MPSSRDAPGNEATTTPQKPKLMDRIRGEAKIFAGKLGGKEEKVEEGRRLKGQDA